MRHPLNIIADIQKFDDYIDNLYKKEMFKYDNDNSLYILVLNSKLKYLEEIERIYLKGK